MKFLRLIIVPVIAIQCATVAMTVAAAPPAYLNSVAPILKNRCIKCHGPAKQEGKLNLALLTGIARGGETGPAIVSGKPDESPLWQLVESDEMPKDEPLNGDEKKILREWIEAGAKELPGEVPKEPDGDEHWAFQKLRAVQPPAVRDDSRIRTNIDRFIQARLESVGLSIGPEANRAALIRRVSFDLTGLPPQPAEIEQFLNDTDPRAYENMVERYLTSPRYGERWGKYWLDAAGYADSNGYFGADTDRPLAYRYRDYVIRSLNSDKPWDLFIREQLAGDELAGYQPGGEVSPAMVELLEAAHFLRNSPDGTDNSDGNPDELRADKYAVLEGSMQIIGSSLLGITVQCARCHDHKFEPFSQRDFYGLQAVIYPAFNVEKWVKPKEREINAVPAAELAAWEVKAKYVEEQVAELRAQLRDWARDNRERGNTLFHDDFDQENQKVAATWSNKAPGDTAPSGQPAINLDSPTAPGAQISQGVLQIVESRDEGDRALSTQQSFDWTPDGEGAWIQVTFDLIKADAAPYVGYLLALKDFNDTQNAGGGNLLIDGAADGKATVHVDYPGGDSKLRGTIGQNGYTPGRSYGVRITNSGGQYLLTQLVDGISEEGVVELSAEDLPDGGFGFEYCCGRSFVVDNVRIEVADASPQTVEARKQLAEAYRKKTEELNATIRSLEAQRGDKPGRLAIVCDLSPEPPTVPLLERGSYKAPKDNVGAAAPAAVSETTNPPDLIARNTSTSHSTGRRLALAQWITQPNSRAASLLARVTVNRWWQHHFGTGIVATADNLGYSGAPPTHPELLEYLAAKLTARNWSPKAVHREILGSAVYRQVSFVDPEARRLDEDNRLLSRYPLRRLDAEAVRDAMLAVSGELDQRSGGPYVPTVRDDDGDVVVHAETPGALRRSVFLQQRRTQVVGMLEAFDAPSIVFNCTMRTPTTVPLQSLKLLNSAFVRSRAATFADRLAHDSGEDSRARIDRAYLLAFGRAPTAQEQSAALQFVSDQPAEYDKTNGVQLAWTDFCQMLMVSNPFLYID